MQLRRTSFLTATLLAVVLHAAVAAVLARVPAGEAAPQDDIELQLHLPLPKESPKPPMIIVAAMPEPEPEPNPTPVPTPPPQIDDAMLREIEEEKQRVREELRRARSPEALPPMPAPPALPPDEQAPPRHGNLSTIRELNLHGYPDEQVKQVMQRYRMNVRMKMVQGGSNQSFLSSASGNAGDTFYAQRDSPPGLYQVFELTPAAVAKMSALEEDAIRARGMEPVRTHVKRIRFGIVQTDSGYDLGVLEMDAESL